MIDNIVDADPILVVENITKTYGHELVFGKIHVGRRVKAIDKVSFSVKKGEIFGFLGPNGAGKTTLIRVILDYLLPESGTITIFGMDHHRNALLIRKSIGYVPGDVALYENFTGLELLEYFSKYRPIKEEMLSELHLIFKVDLTQKIGHLSKGNKQQLVLLLALASNPDFLIFDEPSSGLDPLMASRLHTLLKKMRDLGKTIFLSSHDLTEVQNICDRVGIIKKGRIIIVESIDELRRKSLQNIRVGFADSSHIPSLNDFSNLKTVVSVRTNQKNVFQLKIKEDINELMRFLANYIINRITIEDSSLEEIFLEFYGDESELMRNISSNYQEIK